MMEMIQISQEHEQRDHLIAARRTICQSKGPQSVGTIHRSTLFGPIGVFWPSLAVFVWHPRNQIYERNTSSARTRYT